MDVIYYLVPLALLLGGGFLVAFLYAVRTGQFDDLDTPAYRMLIEEEQRSSQNEQH